MRQKAKQFFQDKRERGIKKFFFYSEQKQKQKKM